MHVAAGAYMADRNTARGVRFSRDLALRVAVLDPDAWNDQVLDAVADLLGWLTGGDVGRDHHARTGGQAPGPLAEQGA